MKKILAFCLTLVMLAGMSVPAFAAMGGFVSSPGGNKGPELVEYDPVDHECTAELVVTPYGERHELSAEKRATLEKAYSAIVNTTDIKNLSAEFKAMVEKKGWSKRTFAVTDLFDVSYYDCSIHENHNGFEIVIKPETLNNFVGLLHLNDGTWELVDNAKVEKRNGVDVLTFTVETLSPFAIVVDTDTNPPVTSDNYQWVLYVSLMVVSASVMVYMGNKLRKQEN